MRYLWQPDERGGQPLTPREREILQHVCAGLSNVAIATRLDISVHTVRNHLTSVYAKLEADGRVELVVKALKENLVQLEDL